MNFFYEPGIDITHDREMFNFVRSHFRYHTSLFIRCTTTIANNVKLYKLGILNWGTAQAMLEKENYGSIHMAINRWERVHPDYVVRFEGRSCGYLILLKKNPDLIALSPAVPELIEECADYKEYKQICKERFGGVKYNREELRNTVKLIQSFDKLCDELRDLVKKMSCCCYEIYAMNTAVADFNRQYANDLKMLNFAELRVDVDGIVDLSEVIRLQCLTEAFLKFVEDYEHCGYRIVFIDASHVRLQYLNRR